MIRKLLCYINETRNKNKVVISELEEFLLPGSWISSIYGDVLYNTSTKPRMINNTFMATHPTSRTLSFFYPFISKLLTIRIKSRDQFSFLGSEIVITSSGHDYKIFDYEKKMVLTRFEYCDLRIKIESAKSFFSKWFYVPQTFHIDYDNKIVIEEYLVHNVFNCSYAFEAILSSYLYYISDSKISFYERDFVHNCINEFCENFEISKVPQINSPIAIVMSHGDLWSSNIIFNHGNYYLTDFESCKERYVFYDLFYFIFSEWMIKKDDSLIKNYIEGKYDSAFLDISRITGTEFILNKRKEYFFIFICLVYEERWKRRNDLDENIYNFLKYYGII